jgi:Tfp pilus assembly protein FimT
MNEEANSRLLAYYIRECLVPPPRLPHVRVTDSLQQTRTSAVLAVLPPSICTSAMHNQVNTSLLDTRRGFVMGNESKRDDVLRGLTIGNERRATKQASKQTVYWVYCYAD